MFDIIKENVVKPSLTRVGFLLTGWLVGQGVASDYAHMVGTGVIGLGLIILDLCLAYLRKRGIEQKAFVKGALGEGM